MPGRDETFMMRALKLAQRGWGKTTPNPMVGAVLVRDGKIISEGWHKMDGGPHAEVECIKNLGREAAEGATLYVTLEPCSTRGRTGACTDLIISKKISEVKIGALDPNPAHSGAALKILSESGIRCEWGILGEKCAGLNFIFNHIITRKTPLLAIKYAQSADGKISRMRTAPTPISGAEARAECMKMRELFDAVGVGCGTLRSDNPSLTARCESRIVKCPKRLVFNASLSLADGGDPLKYNLFSDEFRGSSIVICDSKADDKKIGALSKLGMRIAQMPCPKDSPDFWSALRDFLWNEKIYSLMIEGGANLFGNICRWRAADYAFEYTSATRLGHAALPAFENGKNFKISGDVRALGEDRAISGAIAWNQDK